MIQGKSKLIAIEAEIAGLNLEDQVRLLQFLAPRIAGAILPESSISTDLASAPADAWRSYRALGERLAATSVPGAASLTDAVSKQRR